MPPGSVLGGHALIWCRASPTRSASRSTAYYGNPLSWRIADSSSTNAVNFSSARTTKRFLSPRCASAIQIVRPTESTAETQPQLQPGLLRYEKFTPVMKLETP
jgi:hypothetical protein